MQTLKLGTRPPFRWAWFVAAVVLTVGFWGTDAERTGYAEVHETTPKVSFKSGGARSEIFLARISETLERIDARLERIERQLTVQEKQTQRQ